MSTSSALRPAQPLTSIPAAGRPMSEVIRERIRSANRRFHANDNIAEFIRDDDELQALQTELTEKLDAVLRAMVIDVDGDHNTQGSARRVA